MLVNPLSAPSITYIMEPSITTRFKTVNRNRVIFRRLARKALINQSCAGAPRGSTIQAKHIGKDIMSGLRSVVGGELTEYSEMLEEAREKAVNRMMQDAEKMGADAVVNVRFMTSMVMAGAAEMLAYGTAVKIKDKE